MRSRQTETETDGVIGRDRKRDTDIGREEIRKRKYAVEKLNHTLKFLFSLNNTDFI